MTGTSVELVDRSPPVRRVFVTGGLGFIGGALLDRYREAGTAVCGADRTGGRDGKVIAGDISDPGGWQAAARGSEMVVHTAAVVSNVGDLASAWRINVLGTRRALDAAVAGGARRFIHISSVRAFSDVSFPDGVDETWPVRTDGNPYVDTKVASEQVVLQAHAAGEIECTVIRPTDVYGPGSRPWTVLPVKAIKSGRFLLPAWGNGVFSPVYIDNLIDGIVLAAAAPEAAGMVITIGDAQSVSCREFFGHYCRMLGVPGPRCVPTRVAVGAAALNAAAARARGSSTEANPVTMRYLARTGSYSINRAHELLGYRPRVELAEGMRRTEAWLQAEGLL